MTEAKKKEYKGNDVVLKCEKVVEIKGQEVVKKFDVTPNSFVFVNFDGVKIIKGEDYYIAKAKKAGAK